MLLIWHITLSKENGPDKEWEWMLLEFIKDASNPQITFSRRRHHWERLRNLPIAHCRQPGIQSHVCWHGYLLSLTVFTWKDKDYKQVFLSSSGSSVIGESAVLYVKRTIPEETGLSRVQMIGKLDTSHCSLWLCSKCMFEMSHNKKGEQQAACELWTGIVRS